MNFLKKFCAAWSLPLTKSNCLRRCSKHKGFQVSNDSVAQWMLFFLHFTFSKDYREASFVSIRPILLEIRIFWKKLLRRMEFFRLRKVSIRCSKHKGFLKSIKSFCCATNIFSYILRLLGIIKKLHLFQYEQYWLRYESSRHNWMDITTGKYLLLHFTIIPCSW